MIGRNDFWTSRTALGMIYSSATLQIACDIAAVVASTIRPADVSRVTVSAIGRFLLRPPQDDRCELLAYFDVLWARPLGRRFRCPAPPADRAQSRQAPEEMPAILHSGVRLSVPTAIWCSTEDTAMRQLSASNISGSVGKLIHARGTPSTPGSGSSGIDR
jgi:hypothetical protein